MIAIANIILPVFAVILVGYGLRKFNILGPSASTDLNRFVVWLALPALTIDIMISNPWQAFYQPGFLVAFEISVAVIFAGVLIWRRLQTRDLGQSTIECTAASYANNGYIGLPLCALTFGQENLAPTLVAATLTVSVNFAASILLLEISTHAGKQAWRSMGKVLAALLKNPLILAPIAGGVLCASGWALPQGVMQSIKLLSGAASPSALVAIGLFLAQDQPEKGRLRVSAGLVFLKLVVQPAIAWYLAFHVFEMPPLWAHSLVLLSALPTGTGPFMLADLYRRGAGIASRTILWSTVAAVPTLAFWLAILK